MIDPVAGRTWAYRALFVALIALIVFVRLLPFGHGAGQLPGPDLALALTCAWVLRRPSYVPAALVVAVFLPLDFLLQQPPGLGALAALAGTEVLRARIGFSREMPFPVEWAMVAATLLGMAAMVQLAQAALLLERPPLGLALLRALFTAAVYPPVVLFSAYALGIRKATPGEVDALGDRL